MVAGYFHTQNKAVQMIIQGHQAQISSKDSNQGTVLLASDLSH